MGSKLNGECTPKWRSFGKGLEGGMDPMLKWWKRRPLDDDGRALLFSARRPPGIYASRREIYVLGWWSVPGF